MIKAYFKDWNRFEIIFLISGLILSIGSAMIFDGDIINILYTSTYFITALLMSKGKVESYIIGFVSVFFYGIVSYRQQYYGELLITVFLTLPIMVVGIISWLRHQDSDDNVVMINVLPKKEIIYVFLSQLIMFWGYYFLLKVFNTPLLGLSALSIVTSVLASYFEARRSELCPICYIANDFVIIVLWLTPIIAGDTKLISVLVGPFLLLVNDIYCTYNWRRLKETQSEKYSKTLN